MWAQEEAAKKDRSLPKLNKAVSSRFITRLKGLEFDSKADVLDCLGHVEQLDLDDKNISEAILASDELKLWTRDKKSRTIDIDLETPPNDLVNPLSFTCSLLVVALKSTAMYPVLSFFCQHRNNDDPADDRSGPLALINSLNGQLIKFMAKSRPTVDLSELEDEPSFRKARESLKHSLTLFKLLLSALGDDDLVFVIIDCLSSISGSEEDGNTVVKTIIRMAKRRGRAAVKLLVTDPAVDSPVRELADISFHVQDLVVGTGVIDVSETSFEIAKRVGRRRKSKNSHSGRRSDSSSESEEDTENDDSDS